MPLPPALGHEIERFLALRHRIQDLIDDKVILSPGVPSETSNPLLNHTPGINALITREESFDPVHLITDAPVNRSLLPSPSAIRELVGYELNTLDQDMASSKEEIDDTKEE